MATTQPNVYGDLRIDVGAREIWVGEELVTLTPKEFDLLLFLAQSPRQVFSRRQLLEHVWDSSPDYQDPATITVHIGRLRQKLEADPGYLTALGHHLPMELDHITQVRGVMP